MRKYYLILLVLSLFIFGTKTTNAQNIINGGFESGDFTGWSVDTNFPGYSWDTPSGITQSATITVADAYATPTEGTQMAKLVISGSVITSCGTAHGPALTSSIVSGVQVGDVITFDWKAVLISDDYDVYAFIVDVATGSETQLLYQTGSVSPWTTTSLASPYNGDIRFKFVCGTHDLTCGNAVGANMYIDNIKILRPTATDATLYTATGFNANWLPYSGATIYYLDIATDIAFANIDPNYNNKNVGNVTTYAATGLAPGTIYYYRLRGSDGVTTSGNSNIIQTAPGPVATAATDYGAGSFTANWNLLPLAIGYNIDVATDATFTNILPSYNNVSTGNVGTYSITGVATNSNYYYRVKADYNFSFSTYSNIINAAFAPIGLVYNPAIVVAGINSTNISSLPTTTGGSPVASYSISPALPTGVSLDPTTGIISGIPTVLSPLTVYTVTATNVGGSTTGSFTLTTTDIIAPSALTYDPNPVVAIKGVTNVSSTPTSSGSAVDSYSVSPALPTGITLNPTTGVISGIPTVISAVADYTVTATNSAGNTTCLFNLSVIDIIPSGLTYTPNPIVAIVGVTNVTSTPSTTGGTPVVSYAIVPALPAGLIFNTTTGVISGTPTATLPATNFTVTATNTAGNTTATVTVIVTDAEPTVQAHDIIVNNKRVNKLDISWTNGNGAKRAVFVFEGNSGQPVAVDGTSYVANVTFGIGDQIGNTGWFCVYNGTGSNVLIENLTVRTEYRIMVLEYNGTAGIENYNLIAATLNPITTNTLTYSPTVQAHDILTSNRTKNSIDFNWTNGDGERRVVFVNKTNTGKPTLKGGKEYTANTVYGSGSADESGAWSCVYDGTGSSVNVTGLDLNSEYRVMVCEYNYYLPGYQNYLTIDAVLNPINTKTLAEEPTVQAHDIIVNDKQIDKLDISWTNGNGENRAVFVFQGNSGNAPAVDGLSYISSNSFGLGDEIGSTGWFCVYNGTASNVLIESLAIQTEYQIMVLEYNGISGSENYNLSEAFLNPITTNTLTAAPTVQSHDIIATPRTSTSLTFNWTKGNGSNRVVFLYQGNSGQPQLSGGKEYPANAIFKSGSTDESGNWYCIYNGTGSTIEVTGLTLETQYRIMVCEYNYYNSGYENYLTDVAVLNPINTETLPLGPSVQASNIIFSNIEMDKFSASWTRGNGLKNAAFVKQTSAIESAVAVNLTEYVNKAQFKTGDQIGSTGWYCVYNGTGKQVDVTGLSIATDYRMMVVEYNGTTGNQVYNNSDANMNPESVRTIEEATTANIPNFFSPDGDGINDYWNLENVDAKTYKVYIYNNIGALIFQSDNYDNTWDGSYEGNELPSDTYYYVLIDGSKIVKGTISLVR